LVTSTIKIGKRLTAYPELKTKGGSKNAKRPFSG